MKLASLLTPAQVILDLRSEDHMDSIVELVDHLISNDLIDVEIREEVLQSLKDREDQISTGIGYGVAIPHAFSDNVDKVTAVFGRSKSGIDFESLDNAPVNFIVLFVVPRKDYNMHLQTLAAIAKMFNNCEVRQQLADAEDVEAILEIFASRPSRIHSEC
ncbi:PTS sugar transporter subunit IIA [Persicirhabdus sediminis]|uniref:PTS sugar transporter subunit IIA n=1 Tax=Persicirhabdus sediminis TaxID=454144 RepID=A0A8J7ME95_9BACT|nr:PTS sugar transporter subunit IIA [Persicirhabdus sediminis]MBK1791777.1 PTS sugar transporter subunit IIA [Persicirhabdus sediminis]